jgi:hypothetical protein
MAAIDRFNRLQTLFGAIQKLDSTVSVENSGVIDLVFEAVKDIPKTEYPVEYQEKIIGNIRDALIALYNEEIKQLSVRIGLDFQDPKKTAIVNDPQSSPLRAILEKTSRLDINSKEED